MSLDAVCEWCGLSPAVARVPDEDEARVCKPCLADWRYCQAKGQIPQSVEEQ